MLSRTPWLSAWFPVLLAAPLVSQRASPVDRQLVAAGLWAEARYNYAYWDAVRANWDSAFAATVTFTGERPAPSDQQFVHRLRRWGALLHDGQLEILPPAAIANRIARPPLALRSIERRPFIMDYVTNDEMRVARPERLAEILAVQGVPAAEWIRDSILPEIPAATEASRWDRAVAQMLEGERGTAVHLLLRLPGGQERGASVTRSMGPLERPALEADTLPDGAIWVQVNSLADPDVLRLFDRALGDAPREGLRHRGLILDLRETIGTGTGGGGGGREQAYALLSRLIERPFLGSRRRVPQYRADSLSDWLSLPADTIWPPVRRERIAYTGPVVVLISPRTGGAAEDLVVAFQTGGRGPTMGETSAGSTGKTATLTLPAGWKLRLTVSRDAFPDGKEFMPIGIAPQFPVEVRVADVLAGRDAVLDRARAYLSDAARR
jgi:C-terminal processing protease CtpA/Prc